MKVLEPYQALSFCHGGTCFQFRKIDVVLMRSRSLQLVKNSCKLPKLEVPKFPGNSADWPGFWDQFLTFIHTSYSLSDFDHFNYLKKCLCGSAASCVSKF